MPIPLIQVSFIPFPVIIVALAGGCLCSVVSFYAPVHRYMKASILFISACILCLSLWLLSDYIQVTQQGRFVQGLPIERLQFLFRDQDGYNKALDIISRLQVNGHPMSIYYERFADGEDGLLIESVRDNDIFAFVIGDGSRVSTALRPCSFPDDCKISNAHLTGPLTDDEKTLLEKLGEEQNERLKIATTPTIPY